MLLRVKKKTVAVRRGWDLEAEAGDDKMFFFKSIHTAMLSIYNHR